MNGSISLLFATFFDLQWKRFRPLELGAIIKWFFTSFSPKTFFLVLFTVSTVAAIMGFAPGAIGGTFVPVATFCLLIFGSVSSVYNRHFLSPQS
jgi:MFS superfamily sulfate permease-like transporter